MVLLKFTSWTWEDVGIGSTNGIISRMLAIVTRETAMKADSSLFLEYLNPADREMQATVS